MKRWIRLAATLYPQGWRERYGEEFQALLEDVTPGWREFADVALGALKMQMSTSRSYLKVAGATALAGTVVAVAASFVVPRQYVSEAVVRMKSKPQAQAALPAPPKEALDNAAADQFNQLTTEILGRYNLVDIIQEPSLDLYREERQRMPMEEVILRMRQKIRISPLPRLPSGSGPPLTARISFAYPDKEKAQEVVRRLVSQFVTLNTTVEKSRAAIWHVAWPPSDPLPPGEEVVVLDPPSTPKPVSPNRLEFVAWGLGGGLLLGLLATTGMRRPKWTLQLAGFAVAGCALAVAGSFLIPNQYTSTAVLRFAPPIAPPRLSSQLSGIPAAERFQQLQQAVLTRESLSQIILKPSLDLYPKQRAHATLEDIIESMRRRDLRIQTLRPGFGGMQAFAISFSYPDRDKASAVVHELVSRFVTQHLRNAHLQALDLKPGGEVRMALEHKIGENLEVLEPANVPELPEGPKRLTFAAAGLAFGLIAGVLTMKFRQLRIAL